MKAKHIIAILGMTMILTLAGCGSKGSVVEVTPTPAATPTPTEVPVTVTPVPTSTPAPKVIGVKTSQAKYIYLTNSLQSDIREIYLMTSGGEDWGKNLIPAESSVKAAEQVQMYYTADSSSTDSSEENPDATTDTSGTSTLYDMKIVTASGDAYQIYSIDLGDMEKASLAYDEESSVAYLRYMSLSEKKEKDTKDNSQQEASSDDSSSDDSSSDGSSSEDNSSDGSSSDDSSYDSSDDSSYDNSSDDNSYDDSSYDNSDDNSFDDSNSDDGSYDDSSSDDGSYDDSSDDYADEGFDADEEY